MMEEKQFHIQNFDKDQESIAQRITEEWEKLFPRYNPEKPWHLDPAVFSTDQMTAALQVAFPDRSFTVEPLPKSKGYTIRYTNETGAWATAHQEKRHECVGHIPTKHYSNDIKLYSLNDIRNFIAHPEAFYEFMDNAKIKQEMRFKLIMRADNYLDDKQLITSGFYDTRTEGSNFLRYTLSMLLGYALERSKNTELLSKILKDKRENFKEADINELREKQVLQDMRIVDIGCGRQGRFVKSLAEFGAEVFGLDIQPPANPNDSVVHKGNIADMRTVPEKIRNQQYDAILSTMTFLPEVNLAGTAARCVARSEAIAARQKTEFQAFCNALFLVKPGGHAIFVPSVRYRVSEIAELKDKFIDLTEQHPLLKPLMDHLSVGTLTVIQAKT